jgi:VIT1/CCC1 family predicted Fe2+/Mn2+ transporter
MRDLEYINEHLIGISEDAYHNIKDRISDSKLTHESPKFKNWLYSPPHTRSFGNRLQVFLQVHLPTWLSWSNSEKKSQPAYYAKGNLPTKISMTVRVLAGLIVALASAAAIIVPIVVMSFGASKNKSLVVTSVAVVLFGFVLAAVVKARSENVFIATATYAAVLVVFVGVSGGNGG